MIFNARTKNQHVSEIEVAIRVVKIRVRGVKNNFPYTWYPVQHGSDAYYKSHEKQRDQGVRENVLDTSDANFDCYFNL